MLNLFRSTATRTAQAQATAAEDRAEEYRAALSILLAQVTDQPAFHDVYLDAQSLTNLHRDRRLTVRCVCAPGLTGAVRHAANVLGIRTV